MGQSLAVPRVIPNDWKRLDLIINKIKMRLGRASSPTFTDITITGLTASSLLQTDANKKLTSIALPLIVAKGGTGAITLTDHGILLGSGTGAITPLGVAGSGYIPIGSAGADPVLALITGTANQIISTPGAGSITLSLPQDYHTGASPTLAGLTLSNLIQGSVVFAGASSVISQDNSNLFWDSTNNRLGIGINSGFFPATGITVSGEMDLIHTSSEADDHAFEIDVDAAGYGDVKAIDINYITGAIAKGEDEGIILINIDEIAATGGDVFGLEILTTEAAAASTTTVYGLKAGVLVGPIHQDSGTFDNPTVATNDTLSTNVPYMIDGLIGNVTPIFSSDPNDDDYILIGDIAVFEEIEFIITTGSSGAGIKPKFEYSRAGSNLFTEFFPVDGTNGFRNTGVVAWDAGDLTNHGLNTDTTPDTYCIKITRQRTNLTTTPILGFAKVAATTEYIWDAGGNVNIKTLTISTIAAESSDVDKFLVDSSGVVKYRTGTQVLSDIGAVSIGGSDTQLQYNNSGALAGASYFTIESGELIASYPIRCKSGFGVVFYDDDNSHYAGITAPTAITTNRIYRLPVADGNVGDVLTTDGIGRLSWGTGAAGGNDGYIQYNSSGVLGGDSAFSIDYSSTPRVLDISATVKIHALNELRFQEGSDYVGFKAAAVLAVTHVWVLPTADGPANEAWGTDGSGNLIWRTHDELAGFVANEHIDHTSITLTAGTGLTGGGDISANRTFAVDGVLEDLDTLGANSADSEFLVGTGAGALAWENAATAATSMGLGTGDSPTFAACSLGTGELTCGSINRATGTLTLEINGTAEISITTTTVTLGGNLIIPDSGTIGSASDTDVMTIDSSGNCTFSVFPITPSVSPDADYEVANKKYVDDNVGNGGAGYVGYIKVTDTKAQNTDGGGATSGAWRTRDLTTENTDTGSDCSLASNQITLTAGTYECYISSVAYGVHRYQCRLYNTTGAAVVLTGTPLFLIGAAVTEISGHSLIAGRFSIAASQTLEVQYQCELTHATHGLGVASNFTSEVYTIAEFWRVS